MTALQAHGYVPRLLQAVTLVEAVQVWRGSALLVWGRGERGGGLVAVGGGGRGGVVPLRRAGTVLTALRQIRPLREGGAPLLVRSATRQSVKHNVKKNVTNTDHFFLPTADTDN